MILAAALSVALPLIGQERVWSATRTMLRYETSVGWMTVPLKGLLKLIRSPCFLQAAALCLWFLWQSAVSVIKESPVWGVGISDAQEKFDLARPKYQTEEYRLRWIDSKIDSHSQYLQTTMEFGIFGLLILLFLYAYPVFIAENNRKLFSFFILFLCAYQSVFDMFITGPFSAIFGILMILVLSVENNIVKMPDQESLEE